MQWDEYFRKRSILFCRFFVTHYCASTKMGFNINLMWWYQIDNIAERQPFTARIGFHATSIAFFGDVGKRYIVNFC